ncbi:hypothetical protein XA68_15190 [Ophiocordyceps unilateralis]|uniref:Zinc finger PHD-type domain-containing protein n=1 Tax=Ophiocordyceps unilateralis TaxID=268505 RepID=A0A2A9P7D6_OPHUN|nr:hypothetical protein XA68_15190 [Ophiocordyceps unilateralis]
MAMHYLRSTTIARLPLSLRRQLSNGTALPLHGFRVLDMTRVLAGPYCTQILGDLGADVIKIEHPVRGDDTRAWGPPYARYKQDSGAQGPGESAYFLGVNRNKKSLALSFQHRQGVDILHKLVAKCDVLVENYLPGTLAKYSLDYETLRAINPGLVYASITGYGQTGPYSSRAGYDVMVEAEFGLMHITGSRDGPPVKVGVAVVDLTTGLYTSNSIMAALLGRVRSGKGQHIDVALSDCQTATLANIASSCLVSGQPDSGRWGTAHPSIVPYRSFKTKDGDVLFGCGNDRLFGILCDGLGRPEWKDDVKFKTNADRVANRVELEAGIEALSGQRTTQEWLEKFEGSGMPYAAVNDVMDTLNHDHTRARNMVIEMDHPACGPLKMVNTPIKLSERQPTVRAAPPMLGQHTDELLDEHLGLSRESGTGKMGKIHETGQSGARIGVGIVNPRPPKSVQRRPAPSRSKAGPFVTGFTEPFVMDGRRRSPSSALETAERPSLYAPQFADSSSLILDRLRNAMAERGLSSDTGPETRRKDDTLVMPQNQQKRVGEPLSTPSLQPSLKRKRTSESVDAVDFTQNSISLPPLPAPASPQSAVVPLSQPKEAADETDRTCCVCLEALRGPEKTIVTCHVCRSSWHQLCVSASGQDASYLCAECKIASGYDKLQQGNSLHRRQLVNRIRAKRLASLPAGVVPAKPELVGFLARQASVAERTDYFCGKTSRDLLDILTLCDRLKPRLLVDVLVSVSKKEPDLPIFDDPAWRTNLPGRSPLRSKPTLPSPQSPRRPRPAALVLPNGKELKRPRGRPRNVLKQIIVSQTPEAGARSGSSGGEGEAVQRGPLAGPASTSTPPTVETDNSLPPTWPRAGQGLYAKLPPEDEERAFLIDHNDEEAFSHFMVDKLGKQVVVSVCA